MVGAGLSMLLTLPLSMLVARATGEVDGAHFWVAGLIFTFWYGLAYLFACHVAFRGLSGAGLRDRIIRTRATGTRARLYAALIGGSSSSIAVQFSLVALAGVLVVVISEEHRTDPAMAGSAVAGVVGAWVLMTTAFASRYVTAWALDEGLEVRGPEDDLTFGDFGYIAVQLSTAFTSADVRLTRRTVRRAAMLHSLVAFAFSTVIVALVVALIAGTT